MFVCASLLISMHAQQNDGLGNYRLFPLTPATGPRSFQIGPAYSTGGAYAYFSIRGDQIQAVNQTTEVFRSVGSPGLDARWRFFVGGPAATQELGRIYTLDQQPHFNISAMQGSLRFHTDSLERMRLYQTQTSTISAFPNIPQDGFLL